ncbi:MAG TPA: serine/threonine-protein kinase [Thermoanaerobaculia bacterium]|nr:serine/threonine-protein kinase [Thermoanaerobaculia bacterium]
MTPERWQEVKAVLDGALERAPSERAAFVAAACGEDEELRQEVDSLLDTEAEVGEFLSEPVFATLSGGLDGLEEGRRIGPYRIVREIGRGGMGQVYLAVRADDEYEKQVAVKVVGWGLAEAVVHRFRAERQILANLDHPNIAKLLDGGTTEDGRPYFVMEHVEGRPIDHCCAGLPVEQRLELFRTVCAAVHFAHQNLVVHRDLKPGNILVTAEGIPKLLDFGIAKLLDPGDSPSAFTELGLRPMTLEAASPEQVAGLPITTASDVYSLGVLLFGLLTGGSPYGEAAASREALERAVREAETGKPSEAVGPEEGRRLTGDLDNVVRMALEKDPRQRYVSAAELARDVERHLAGLPVVARRDTFGYRAGKFVRRHKLGVGAAAAGLALILGFSAALTVFLQRAIEERRRAETVSAFLGDLFATTDPSRSRGEEVSAREVLDRGAARIAKELQGQPELQADLMATMGRAYRSLGLYQPARALLEKSLAIRRAALDPDDARLAESLLNLAFLLEETGDFAGAEPLVREAVEIQRRTLGEDDPEYAKGLNNLASLLQERKELDAAEALYRRVLAIKKRSLGEEHEDVARTLNNLARLLYAKGDLAGAEPLYRLALAIRKKRYGDRPHPEVARNLNNLAVVLADRGDGQGAEAMHREALAMRRALYREPHRDVAESLNNLAFLLRSRGDFAAAEPLYREAVEIAGKVPEIRKSYAVFLRNHAALLTQMGRAAEAEPRAREALEIFQGAQNPSEERTADAQSVLGGCLAAQGRFEEAEPLLLGSYEVLKEAKGENARFGDEARERIAALYSAWGRPARAAAFAPRPSGAT